MSTQNPTLAEVLDAAMHHRLRETFGGWMPVRVEAYDQATNRASVQPLLLDDYEDEDGERQTEPFPVLTDVPVGFMSLGGKFCIRSTVSVGDEGIYLSPARPTGKWLQVGGVVDPEDDASHHDINGGIFLPYRISVGGSNASAMIEITASTVNIGGTQPLVTKAEFDGHTHGATGLACTGGTVSGTTLGASAVTGTPILRG